jgi:alkylation response protein AidB-like acyl-CoA dehydrogenase
MRFGLSQEQEELRTSTRRLMVEAADPSDTLRHSGSTPGYDQKLWRTMSDLGLPGLHVPEAYGGQGFGLVELMVVLEEMGRVLLKAPFFATACLAANAILCVASDTQKHKYLPGLASGATLGTVAGPQTSASGADKVIAKPAGGDGLYQLTGSRRFVVDGLLAELIIVAATIPGDGGISGLFAIDARDSGVRRTAVSALDLTRNYAHVELENAVGARLGDPGYGDAPPVAAQQRAIVCLCAEMLGGAEACLDMSVQYAKVRTQFGRTIGSFQAIKHKCADVLVDIESARAVAYYAGWMAENNTAELALAASMSKSVTSEAFYRAASENIQIHGGIGFTWEHPAHLYFRRAQACSTLFGDPAFHRELVAREVLASP